MTTAAIAQDEQSIASQYIWMCPATTLGGQKFYVIGVEVDLNQDSIAQFDEIMKIVKPGAKPHTKIIVVLSKETINWLGCKVEMPGINVIDSVAAGYLARWGNNFSEIDASLILTINSKRTKRLMTKWLGTNQPMTIVSSFDKAVAHQPSS